MELAVTVKTAREGVKALADKGDALGFLAWQFANKRANTQVTVSVAEFDLESLQTFHKVMKENDEDDAHKVQKLIKSLKDTENNKVSKLEDFPKFFKEYLKANDNPLLHSLHTELRGIAYLPTHIKYYPEYRERHYTHQAHVDITFEYNTKMQNRTYSITLHQRDMHQSIPAILRAQNLMVPDETMLADYKKIKKRFEEYGGMQAEQFLCRGDAVVMGGDDYWWRSRSVTLNNMGKPTKAVLDIENLESSRHSTQMRVKTRSDIYEGIYEIPTHPVLPLFSLVHHKMVWVNVINMKPYKYEEDLKEKLVLPKTHVRLIGALVSNIDALRDENEADNKSKTIKAKASSSVILCKGPAGTGKTLTAEVYAEEIKRPLYEVQSGQIGTDPETLEDRLVKVLERSIRLRMPLLINEADVFIHKRGDDLHQNAIVSVFLRLLEYHNGLVFLTTNREVDSAILSRCIAEIEYDVPKPTERLRLWQVMLKEFNVELSGKELRRIVLAMPEVVGRDIQNLIRLTNRVGKALNEPFSLQSLKDNAAFKSIKVLSDEEVEAEIERRKKKE
jgi:hypothetical protein